MDYLNIALVLLGLIAALVTFAGQTWDRTKPKFIQKITHIGWVSLLLITLTFSLGIYKEFVDSRVRATQSSRIGDQERDLKLTKRQIEQQYSELENATRQIEIQKAALSEARQKLEVGLKTVENDAHQKSCASTKSAFVQSALGYATSISKASQEAWQRYNDLVFNPKEDPAKAGQALVSMNVDEHLHSYPEFFRSCLESIFKNESTPYVVPSQEMIQQRCAVDLMDDNFAECETKP